MYQAAGGALVSSDHGEGLRPEPTVPLPLRPFTREKFGAHTEEEEGAAGVREGSLR